MRHLHWIVAVTSSLLSVSALAADVPPPENKSDCGYSWATAELKRFGDRVVALGGSRWMVFDTEHRSVVSNAPSLVSSSGSARPNGALFAAGSTLLMPLELRPGATPLTLPGNSDMKLASPRDGSTVATLTPYRKWNLLGLSADGKYAYRIGEGMLDVWSAVGRAVLSTRAPDLPQSPPTSALAFVGDEIHYHVGNELRARDLSDGTTRVVRSHGGLAEKPVFTWSADASYYLETGSRISRVRIYAADGKELHDFAFPSPDFSFAADALTGMPVVGFGKLFWLIQDKQLRFYRVDEPTDGRPPRSVFSVPWPGAPGSNLDPAPRARFDRGTLAVFGPDSRTLQRIDVRGDLPVSRTAQLPGAPVPGSFTADDAGNWALTVIPGVVYASDLVDGDTLHALGCRAP